MSDRVAIAIRLVPWEAQIFQGVLESEGIFATVIVEVNPDSGVSPRARVLVSEDDAQRAIDIKERALPRRGGKSGRS